MVFPFWNFGPDPPFTHTIFSDEVESSGSDDDDDDFVLDALEFSDPIADKSRDKGDEDVGEVVEEDESSEYTESSSDEEVEVDASIAASTVDMNITDTNPNDVFRGNVDIHIEHMMWTRTAIGLRKTRAKLILYLHLLKVRPGY